MKYTKASKVRRNGATIFQRLGDCVLLFYGEVRWVERKGWGWQNLQKMFNVVMASIEKGVAANCTQTARTDDAD